MMLYYLRWAALLAFGALMPLCGQFAHAADHTTYIVALPGANQESLRRVEAVGGSIDHYDGRESRAYIHHSRWRAFLETGIPHRIVETQPTGTKQRAGYPSYAEIGETLSDAVQSHPEIARLVSLGRSVQGRELWAIQISDQPEAEEDEPEFAYISTMHGDETLGVILCLNFLDTLLDGYGSEPAITEWVDETVIWIVPLMNPDGYELGIRWNANDVDLNRAFPEYPHDFEETIWTEPTPDTAGRQPEVAHVMNWSLENNLVLLANYHGGALVVNYPYDLEPGVPSGVEAPAPDDALLRVISSTYADLNPPLAASPNFPGGITNGSAWYSLTGGMQDWHYRFGGAIDITMEVSNIKAPAAATLPEFWEDNRDAMFAYLAWSHRGLRGIVTDRVTGTPLSARVLVDENTQPVFTDPDVGDYHRVLLPGDYTVRVEAPGYIPFTTGDAAVAGNSALRLDVALSQGDINGDGSIDALDLQLAINAVLGISPLPDADVDGGGVSATDIQHLVNRVLGRP